MISILTHEHFRTGQFQQKKLQAAFLKVLLFKDQEFKNNACTKKRYFFD